MSDAPKKLCPYCGEEIMADAKKCKWCGEWLEEDVHSSKAHITCPTCGEQIPEGSKICPLCNEAISTPKPPTSSKPNRLPQYIIGGVAALLLLGIGGVKLNSYLNNPEYQETIENSPYNVISKNLDEAIAKGETLTQFLHDEKNVAALKSHFGDDVYTLMLTLGAVSFEPLSSCDPSDLYAGGYAWKSSMHRGQAGCRLYLGSDKLGCKFYYEGMEVDQFGNIVTNPKWKCDYYKDDFNEDDTSKPYIEQYLSFEEDHSGMCRIRLDNVWGISFTADTYYFDQILLRNDDGEVWNLPIDKASSSEALVRREGVEQFTRWFQTAKGIKMSFVDSTGQYAPKTLVLGEEELRFYSTFMSHVMKKRIDSDIFISNGLNL